MSLSKRSKLASIFVPMRRREDNFVRDEVISKRCQGGPTTILSLPTPHQSFETGVKVDVSPQSFGYLSGPYSKFQYMTAWWWKSTAVPAPRHNLTATSKLFSPLADPCSSKDVTHNDYSSCNNWDWKSTVALLMLTVFIILGYLKLINNVQSKLSSQNNSYVSTVF